MTLEEHLRLREHDAEYQRAKAAADAERERYWEELRRAHLPLIEALNEAGYRVNAVWELMETGLLYAGAVPILLEHLQRTYPGQVRDDIARALAIPEASYGWPILVKEFIAEPDAPRTAKQGLAVALSDLLTEERLDEYLELVHDPRHGDSRLLLLDGLQRLSRRKRSRAREAYAALADDPVLGAEVRRVLARRRGSSSA